MAIPAGVAVAKAAAAVLTDEKSRKRLKTIAVILCSPLIFVIVLAMVFQQAGSRHNEDVIRLCFNSEAFPEYMPGELRNYITEFRTAFAEIDAEIQRVNPELEAGRIDAIRAKAIFLALFFGTDNPSGVDAAAFVGCFYAEEERQRPVEAPPDEDGDDDDAGDESEESEPEAEPEMETYIVKVPMLHIDTIFQNISAAFDLTVTETHKKNALDIYYLIGYNGAPPEGAGGTPGADPNKPFVGVDGFTAPVGGDWRAVVNSEFGWRPDPITGEPDFHRGIDLGGAAGSPIYAALDGTVLFANLADDSSSYGNHLAIDHGGGFVTLYAHNTDLLVTAGQEVKAGEQVATMGNSGRVTGVHVHFEVRVGNELHEPRNYLP